MQVSAEHASKLVEVSDSASEALERVKALATNSVAEAEQVRT